MTLALFEDRGTPLDKQRFTWRELAGKPISKLDDDAFTRVRVILMNGIEMESLRFSHAAARMNGELRLPLAQVRRVEHHQATMINWLLGADHSLIETTIGYEQVAIEVTAALAQQEPDAYLAQAYRFGLLEDFDHMYRFSALLDRLEGKDSNNILQSYTDVLPGRPTVVEHRAPENDLRRPFDREDCAAADQAQRAHAGRGRAADAQLLHEHRSVVRRPARPTAVRGDRFDRATARDALRVAARSAAVAAGELAGARGDGGRTRTTAACSRKPIRGSRRSGSGC